MKQDDRKHAMDENDLTRALRAAMGSLGWLLPETEEEVAAQKKAFSKGEPELPELPERLRDARAALRPRVLPLRPAAEVPPELPHEVEEGLARAAREGGGNIPPEVEARMRRDRTEAEAQEESDGE